MLLLKKLGAMSIWPTEVGETYQQTARNKVGYFSCLTSGHKIDRL